MMAVRLVSISCLMVVLLLLELVMGYNCGSSWRMYGSFAALQDDGSVVSFGSLNSETKDVRSIYSTYESYAALKKDGTVEVWGGRVSGGGTGGSGGSMENWNAWHGMPIGLSTVQSIAATRGAFAVVKGDGSVVSWGNDRQGGIPPSGLTNVQTIYSSERAFAALTSVGTVFA